MSGLLQAVPSGRTSQQFGIAASSVTSREPAMFAASYRAYWNPFSGATYYPHFHPGIDRSAVEGTSIRAMETGVVTWAGLGSPTDPYGRTDGIRIEVEIRPGTRYSMNHLSALGKTASGRALRAGDHVLRGQTIGRIGATGNATGPHAHIGLAILEIGNDGIRRTMLHNPDRYLEGAVGAGDARIRPLYTPPPPTTGTHYATVKGPGINIRTTPDLDVGDTNRWATSRQQGVDGWTAKSGLYLKNGTFYASLYSRFVYLGTYTTDDGVFAKLRTGSGLIRYALRSLVNVT